MKRKHVVKRLDAFEASLVTAQERCADLAAALTDGSSIDEQLQAVLWLRLHLEDIEEAVEDLAFQLEEVDR